LVETSDLEVGDGVEFGGSVDIVLDFGFCGFKSFLLFLETNLEI
jgi:hypothetical protein